MASDDGARDGAVRDGALRDGAGQVRVLLVDDHAVLRAGLRGLLTAADGIEVVAEAGDGESAVRAGVEHQPDVVLMDLSMPGMDGVVATRELLARRPGTAVVALTSFSDPARVRAAVDAGAIGYLLKDSEPADLIAGVRAAARGEAPLDPRVTRALLPGGGQPGGARLSPREREVLALVAKGLANKHIARSLGITERTVKAHLNNVFRQIGVADRTSAALWARENLAS